MEVQIDAYPPPRYTWFTNNRPVQQSARHTMTYEQGAITLLIVNAQQQDSGEYVLHASNELGEVTCRTTLNIKRESAAPLV